MTTREVMAWFVGRGFDKLAFVDGVLDSDAERGPTIEDLAVLIQYVRWTLAESELKLPANRDAQVVSQWLAKIAEEMMAIESQLTLMNHYRQSSLLRARVARGYAEAAARKEFGLHDGEPAILIKTPDPAANLVTAGEAAAEFALPEGMSPSVLTDH